uniref:Uncharacterized protein n=1 Tax=Timema genevievae TaxID=629358 RepID=A0A7R9JVC2_TIMGE|nr:unnamed protein product [Timema genevievae]
MVSDMNPTGYEQRASELHKEPSILLSICQRDSVFSPCHIGLRFPHAFAISAESCWVASNPALSSSLHFLSHIARVQRLPGWKKLAGRQSQALLDVVSRLEQGAARGVEDARARRRRLYRLASEQRPSFPTQQRNFYSFIMENKEVMKTLSLLSTCTQDIKLELERFMERWKPYQFLWKNEQGKRDMMNASLSDFESWLRRHGELEGQLTTEPDMHSFACCLALSTERLKFGLLTEVRACTFRIGQVLKKKYRREMDYVYAVMNEMDRKLERPIRDLDDVRLVMETLKKIREQEVDMELKIEPIEVWIKVILIIRNGFQSVAGMSLRYCDLSVSLIWTNLARKRVISRESPLCRPGCGQSVNHHKAVLVSHAV